LPGQALVVPCGNERIRDTDNCVAVHARIADAEFRGIKPTRFQYLKRAIQYRSHHTKKIEDIFVQFENLSHIIIEGIKSRIYYGDF
jgi:hypothetical protein